MRRRLVVAVAAFVALALLVLAGYYGYDKLQTADVGIAALRSRSWSLENSVGELRNSVGELHKSDFRQGEQIALLRGDMYGACCDKDDNCVPTTSSDCDVRAKANANVGWHFRPGVRYLADRHEAINFDACCVKMAGGNDWVQWWSRECVLAVPGVATVNQEQGTGHCTDTTHPQFRPGLIRLSGQVKELRELFDSKLGDLSKLENSLKRLKRQTAKDRQEAAEAKQALEEQIAELRTALTKAEQVAKAAQEAATQAQRTVTNGPPGGFRMTINGANIGVRAKVISSGAGSGGATN